MNATTLVGNVLTVVASVAAGCAAAISIASTAAVVEAPALHQRAQTEVVRLEPVVVTISKQAYETVRNEERAATALARANVAKTRRG